MTSAHLLDGRLTIRHLVLAIAVADQGTVIGAAEQLRVTQPAVTRGLQNLEALLGARLFERGPRGVTPTVVGAAFLEHARGVVAQLQSAADHVHDLASGDAGTVTIGTHLAGSNVLLPQAVDSFKQAHPRSVVAIHEATPDVLVNNLLTGAVDMVIGRLTAINGPERIAQTPLYREPIRLVVASDHPALALHRPQLADLMAYPWILPVAQTQLRGEIEHVFLRHGLALPDNRVECTSILTLRSLMLASPYVAALPQLIAQADPALAMISTPLEGVSRTVGVSQRQHTSMTPVQQEFLRHLSEVAQRIQLSLRANLKTAR